MSGFDRTPPQNSKLSHSIPASFLHSLENLLSEVTGMVVRTDLVNDVPGSSRHFIRQLFTNAGVFCLKYHPGSEPLFMTAEGYSLNRLEGASLRVPKVILDGFTAGFQFLVTDFIFPGEKKSDFWERTAQNLAQLHRHTDTEFGFESDNFISVLPQKNARSGSWNEFFISRRILPMVELAIKNHLFDRSLFNAIDNLALKINEIFPEEPPALLHGDLWRGNLLTDRTGEPVFIDPAAYFGHREAEIAFTLLFGGFDIVFYREYESVFPLQPGYKERSKIYNLYPLLVHANLFGGHYISDVNSVLQKFK